VPTQSPFSDSLARLLIIILFLGYLLISTKCNFRDGDKGHDMCVTRRHVEKRSTAWSISTGSKN
jgi:hypothetical protein